MPKKQRKAIARRRRNERDQFRAAFLDYIRQDERQAEPPRAFRPRDY